MTLRTCSTLIGLCLLSLPTGCKAESPDDSSLLKDAITAYANGQFARAGELLSVYADDNPVDPEGWYWLGCAALKLGRPPEAVDALGRSVLLRPDYVEAYRPLGLAEYQSGDAISAEKAWKVAVSLNPRDALSEYYLGVLLYQRGDAQAAETWLKACLRDKPNDSQALLYLGLCEQRLEHGQRAEKLMQESIQQALAQNAPLPRAYYALAAYERGEGRDDLALKLLEQAAALCPEAHALAALSDLYKAAKRLTDAERVLRQAVALNPELAEAHYKLALVLKANQKPDNAHAEMAAFEETKQRTDFPDVEK